MVRKKMTLKDARRQISSMYKEGILNPSFALFHGSNYHDGHNYRTKGRDPIVLSKLDPATAKFFERAFMDWIVGVHGKAFEKLGEGL